MGCKTTPEVGGMGHSVKRKEDARFIRGQGRYIEDINLPGQIYMDIVRSPFAHAKIVNIDASAAMETEGVIASAPGSPIATSDSIATPVQVHAVEEVLDI